MTTNLSAKFVGPLLLNTTSKIETGGINMSRPVGFHQIMLAIREPEKHYRAFIEIMRVNMKHGSFTVYPCDCERCLGVTKEEIDELDTKLEAEVKTAGPGQGNADRKRN